MLPLIKSHGGKYYLKKFILENFPDYTNMVYVEGCLGGGSILLNKKPSLNEYAFEFNPDIHAVYYIVKTDPDELINRLSKITYNEYSFQNAGLGSSLMDRAVRYIVRNRMSRNSLGKYFSWSNRLRGNQPEQINAWENTIKRITQIHERLKGVRIWNVSVFSDDLIYLDSSNTLFYFDPPYLKETRSSFGEYGQFEWSKEDHINFSKIINQLTGRVVISGYNSKLYENLYAGWTRKDYNIVNHANQTKNKPQRTESIWLNW